MQLMTACNTASSASLQEVDQLNLLLDESLPIRPVIHLPESEPEEDSGFDFSASEDEEEAAAADDELSQAAVHGQSATIDLEEDDGLGEALGFF